MYWSESDSALHLNTSPLDFDSKVWKRLKRKINHYEKKTSNHFLHPIHRHLADETKDRRLLSSRICGCTLTCTVWLPVHAQMNISALSSQSRSLMWCLITMGRGFGGGVREVKPGNMTGATLPHSIGTDEHDTYSSTVQACALKWASSLPALNSSQLLPPLLYEGLSLYLHCNVLVSVYKTSKTLRILFRSSIWWETYAELNMQIHPTASILDQVKLGWTAVAPEAVYLQDSGGNCTTDGRRRREEGEDESVGW